MTAKHRKLVLWAAALVFGVYLLYRLAEETDPRWQKVPGGKVIIEKGK